MMMMMTKIMVLNMLVNFIYLYIYLYTYWIFKMLDKGSKTEFLIAASSHSIHRLIDTKGYHWER